MNDELREILFEGENVLWQGKPHKLCYIWRAAGALLPIALIWLIFDGFFIGMMISMGAGCEIWPFLVFFFALHLMPVWSCAGKFIKSSAEWKNVVYAVTDKRVVVRSGVIGVDYQDVNYTDISNVRVDVSALEKMCGVGSVYITAASGLGVCLMAIKDPYKVSKQVNQIFMDVKSDIHFPNAYRPDENPGYKTKYLPK